MIILKLWIFYTVMGLSIFSLAFYWAVRTRQFSDQDRARYLPLEGLDEELDAPRPPVQSNTGN